MPKGSWLLRHSAMTLMRSGAPGHGLTGKMASISSHVSLHCCRPRHARRSCSTTRAVSCLHIPPAGILRDSDWQKPTVSTTPQGGAALASPYTASTMSVMMASEWQDSTRASLSTRSSVVHVRHPSVHRIFTLFIRRSACTDSASEISRQATTTESARPDEAFEAASKPTGTPNNLRVGLIVHSALLRHKASITVAVSRGSVCLMRPTGMTVELPKHISGVSANSQRGCCSASTPQ
mmetsp:Transcript_30291/g.75201  ORF Transcript_30291/g.75201 Transcript_30291/m.75201 type:complete len:236 (-) Transcript_30291:756-1463(-)